MSTQTAVTPFVGTTEHALAQDALEVILGRSASDMEFRRLLVDDARAAFAEYGIDLPEGVELSFVENTADVTFVLPEPIDLLLELSEAELAEINGGAIPLIIVSVAKASSGFCVGAAVSVAAWLIGKA